ncbi:MAG TPA: hypothetical protein VIV40_05005 [Kofleriaceae bacterium]
MYNPSDAHRPDHPSPVPPPPAAPYFAPNPAPSYPPAAAISQPQPGTDHRARTAGIALLAATGLVLIAALTKAWFTAGHSGGVGLLGLEKCHGAICESATWFDIKRIPTQIPIFATTALIASLGAIAMLIHTAVMMLQGRPEAVKLKWLSQLLGLTSFGMVAFVFSLSIGDWSRGLSIGWSTFVGLGGLIAASVVTATMVRPLASRS